MALRTVWQRLGRSDLADGGRSGVVQKKIDVSEEKLWKRWRQSGTSVNDLFFKANIPLPHSCSSTLASFVIFQCDGFFFWLQLNVLHRLYPQTLLICFSPVRHQMLINLNASPASKPFLGSHILPTLCTKLPLTSRVTLQIKASIDNTGVLLQIKGSVSLWEFRHISFQMVTLTGR